MRLSTLTCAAVLAAAAILQSCDNPAPKVEVTALVPGSVMHGVQGLAFDANGALYGASFFGQSIYKIDPASGRVDVAFGTPEGEGDDVAIGPEGTPAAGIIAWTAVSSVHSLRPDGTHQVLVANAPRANPIAFSKDGRLFFSQSGTPDNELWEIDPLGAKPARLVSKGQGRLNGFDFGPDGRLYAPLFGTDQLVAIDITTGVHTVVAKGVGSPSAVKVDAKGNLIAVDYKLGDVWHVNPATGETRKLVNRPAVIDNLAIARDGTIYLASTADSKIYALNPDTRDVREVTKGPFNTPMGATTITENGKPTLLIAGPQSYFFYDLATGESVRPLYEDGRAGSQAVAADDKFIYTVATGRLRKIDRTTYAVALESNAVKTPAAVAVAANGDVFVTDVGTGQLLKWNEAGVAPVADGLAKPTALIIETPTTALVAETEAGQVTRVDVTSGARTVVLKGLDHPQGLALLKDGRIAVAETAKGVVAAFDAKSGARTELAKGLPLSAAGLRVPITVPTGMTTGPDGTLYVVGTADNSLWKISFAAK